MRNFNQDRGSRDRRGGGFNRGGDRRRGSEGRGGDFRPEMHRAVCAECGASCEVPFKPTGDKPVYCSNCFANRENPTPRRFNDRDFSRPTFGGEKKMFKVVCDECGKDCEVPFKPSSDKPVYCDECFGKGGESKRSESKKGSGNNSFDKQFEVLNTKLDKLINILTPKNNVIKLSSEDKEEPKKVEVKKAVKMEAKKEVKKVEIVKPVKKDNKKTVKKITTPKVKAPKKSAKK